jgi:hypothetical protein
MADRGEAIASSVGADVERAASGPGGDRLLDHLAPGPARPAAGARHLPVAGPGGPAMGAVLDAARTAALQAVESAAAATGGLRGGWSPVHQADPAAGPWRDGPGSPAGHAGARDPASDPGGSAPDPAGEAVRGVLGASPSAAGDSDSQLSELLEQLEERLLVEIERRGGRYAGVF